MRSITLLVLLTAALAATPVAAQPTYSTGFEPPPFILGDVYGQDGWGHTSNSPTEGLIVAAPAPVLGTQSLQIQTRDIGSFGVTNHLSSAKIDPAGEDGSTIHTVGVQADPATHFFASFWYHTPEEPFISVDQLGNPRSAPGLFAQLNPASKREAFDSPADRYAQIRLSNSTNTLAGLVRVGIGWPTPTGFVVEDVADLQWGQWYRFEVGIHFIEGLGPGDEPNDLFSVRVYDASGALVGVACGSTWEYGYREQGFLGGNTLPLAVNSFDFASNTGPDDRVVGHLDDFTMTSSDAAVAALEVNITGEQDVCAGETTLLTANATGGDGGIVAYEWRDASDAIVGTGPTLEAGAGTYTVTVTDAFCGTATSAPFTIGEVPPLSVAVSGSLTTSPPGPGGTTTLTANPSGGTGTIDSYSWTDGNDAVVGTGSSVVVGPGTYRVTVVDGCGSATSNDVVVTEAAAVTEIPTASTWALILLGMALAAAAVTRLR